MHSFSRAFARSLVVAAALALAPAAASAHEFAAGAITIGHPWSRATPPGAKVAAGYLTLTNKGAEADTLIAATAAISRKGEVHEMKVDAAGVMTMRPVAGGLAIPPGATVALKPGSFHLMFMGLQSPAVEGSKFKGTLTFAKAGTVEVEYAVEGIGGDAHSGDAHSDTGHADTGDAGTGQGG